ncbi:MAG TPA: hypothetical protein VE733_16175 [Streptosporangiaceae bacterium]|nr:hypothetical protein [Streptosporangiaceae bacterium]
MLRTRPGNPRPCPSTITRRLCTVAGFYRYAVEEDLLDHLPAAHVRRPRLDYESHATGLDRNELPGEIVSPGTFWQMVSRFRPQHGRLKS